MPRPPEFDRSAALEVAMKLFWSQGYTATGLTQLLDEIQISRSSFYAAFGDKRTLFGEALQLFAGRTRGLLGEAREDADAVATVRRFFERTLLQVPRYRAARGCLMVNTILELADVDAELSTLAASALSEIEDDFAACFAEAQRVGRYPRIQTPAELGGHVMLLNQGLRVSCRKRVSRAALRREIDLALAFLAPRGAVTT